MKQFITGVLMCMSLPLLAFEYSTESDIVMVGDSHGAYSELVSILQHAKLIDESNNWTGGSTHFVSTGDLMDRGPASRKIMDLFIKLQPQAEDAGGKVHVLLGNHEVLNLIGDWRYISKQEFAEFAQDESAKMRQGYFSQFKLANENLSEKDALDTFNRQFVAGFFARLEAFMPEGVYGEWLHTLPFVIKINEHVFTHGGLSEEYLGMSLRKLNRELKSQLEDYTESWEKLVNDDKLAATTDYVERFSIINQQRKSRTVVKFLNAYNAPLYDAQSPIWYRGNAICHPLFEADLLSDVLDELDAKFLWVGHTVDTKVRQRFDFKLMLMDTGMLSEAYNGNPIYALISGGTSDTSQWQFINARTSQPVEPALLPVRRSLNPYSFSDEQVEAFLQTATIIEQKKLGEGITNPMKITLEKDGKTMRAVFKYFDSGNSMKTLKNAESDRFQYEVAAYKLDRLMGINLVPVATQRTIDGQKGVLQLWIDGLVNAKDMEKDGIVYDGFCHYERQRQMMDVFDYLVHNEDRNLSNIGFTQSDWQLWFFDHTRAFRMASKRPKLLNKANLEPTPEFIKLLQKLDKEKLQILSPWLTSQQIRGILNRRDKLLNGRA